MFLTENTLVSLILLAAVINSMISSGIFAHWKGISTTQSSECVVKCNENNQIFKTLTIVELVLAVLSVVFIFMIYRGIKLNKLSFDRNLIVIVTASICSLIMAPISIVTNTKVCQPESCSQKQPQIIAMIQFSLSCVTVAACVMFLIANPQTVNLNRIVPSAN